MAFAKRDDKERRAIEEALSKLPLVHTGISTFLKLPHVPLTKEALKASKAKAVFLGVPFDKGNIYRSGSEFGPRGIRSASEQYVTFLMDYKIDLRDVYNMVDCGDVPVVTDLMDSHRRTEEAVSLVLESGVIPVVVGGDHSITIPAARALSKHLKGAMGYIHLDAHLDNEPNYGGHEFTNSSHVQRALELPNVRAENVVSLGIHGYMNLKEDIALLAHQGHRVIFLEEMLRRGVDKCIEEAVAIAWDGTEGVYLTIDADVVDGCYASGTTAPEPGGLSAREILGATKILGRAGFNVVDIVEYCPMYDSGGTGLTGGTTGRLLCYVIMGLLGAFAGSPKFPYL